MTRRAKITPYMPLVSACQLPHHRPGSRVVFSRWDKTSRVMRRHTGTVVAHVPDGRLITISVPEFGTHYVTECGHIAKAGGAP